MTTTEERPSLEKDLETVRGVQLMIDTFEERVEDNLSDIVMATKEGNHPKGTMAVIQYYHNLWEAYRMGRERGLNGERRI
jgi:hypothetical protein